MKRLDRTLFLKLDRKKQRYVIYRRDRQNLPREILEIEYNGEFCYPSYEHIAKLCKMDSWQNDIPEMMDRHNESLDEEGDARISRISEEVSKVGTRSPYY